MLASFTVRTRRLLNLLRRSRPAAPADLPLPFWCDDMARRHRAIYRQVHPYTMTGEARVAALCQSIAFLEGQGIAGAVVECGVWKGGSMMAAALALLHRQSTCRPLYLFDTYSGMPPPQAVDVDHHGRSAAEWLADPSPEAEFVRARGDLHEVRRVMYATRYPWKKIHFVPGRVEDVLPAEAPPRIALLRLDTDWYASTAHELEHLWPRLAPGGVLIVDDYGHWQGARRAVDEYFARHDLKVRLHAIDYTARLAIKAA